MATAMAHGLQTYALLALIFSYAFCITVSGELGEEEGEESPGIGVPIRDPAQIVAKALLCFNDKYIYSSCEESYRLSASGDLDVPAGQAEAYCGGPCLTETQLVLSCIDNILNNFLFYNRATIEDVRDTIHAGCGYGPGRGNFNVAEHIQAQENGSNRVVAKKIVIVLGLMVIIRQYGLMLM